MRASLVLLALVLLAAPAVADHVYTHRYTVSGRVLGPDGAPLANVTVEALVDGVSSREGDCKARAGEIRVSALKLADANRTNGYGDFEVCAHVHALRSASSVQLRVADGPWRNLTVDPGVRLTFITVQLDERPADAGEPAPDWNRTLLVRARYWQPSRSPLELDFVPALGEALAGRAVHSALEGRVGRATSVTDAYGDLAYYARVNATAGNVTLTADGAERPARAAFAAGDLRAEAVLFAKAFDLAVGGTQPAEDEPRALVPAVGPVAALAVAAAAGFMMTRRLR